MEVRKALQEQILKENAKTSLLLELPTGLGKTYLSLLKVRQIKEKIGLNRVLVVIPKLVLIKNWEDEIKKWGFSLTWFEFSTYLSLEKKAPIYDVIIFDEAHHLTANNVFSAHQLGLSSTACIFLSASIDNNRKALIQYVSKNFKHIKMTAKDAIDKEALPDPKVLLIPLVLDNTNRCIACKTKNGGVWKQTQQGYYEYLSRAVEKYKQQYMMGASNTKTSWLFMAGQRLKFLAKQKTEFLKDVYKEIKENKSLTFCADTAQAEELGIDTVVSKNANSQEVYTKFNNGEISHIACVNILDEGVNIKDCRIGIYAYIAASDRLVIQRLGRLLRHPNPLLIIPFFVGTREEEILKKMMDSYKKENVFSINKTDISKFL